MVLDKLRGKASFLTEGVASRLPNISPNVLTLLAFIISILFGVAFYLNYLIGSFFILIIASYLDALDGAVARIFGKASKRGDFLDHLLDRYSDIVIIAALSVSHFGNPYLGILGISGTFMTSYVGTQSQAVGLKRIYGGFPGRADRLVIILAGIILQAVLYDFKFLGLYVTSWILIILGVAGLINSVYRAVLSYRSIG
ncbi:MAG: CDP-alcohol phosphatidyltransferase family protein [Thermoplasmatales archaeon]